jgi:hypothetical protein
MTVNPPTDIPTPGWFTDPNVPGQDRWWDGAAWGEQIRPKSAAPEPSAQFDLRGWIGKHRVVVGVVAGAVLLVTIVAIAGSRGGNYDKAAFEQGLKAGMNEAIDSTRIQKVDCPASAPTSQGTTFECLASGIDGSNLVVKVTIQDGEGGYIWQVQ